MHGDSKRGILMELDSSGTNSLTQHLSQVCDFYFFFPQVFCTNRRSNRRDFMLLMNLHISFQM